MPPSIFVVDPEMFKLLSVRVSGSNLQETLRGVDNAWREIVPEQRINRVFLDDRIAELYVDIAREGTVFTAFSGFAVIIGCLGLIGLSAYIAERRAKEIGIRRALGASCVDVTRLLVWESVKPVLMANVLAWPLAFWLCGNGRGLRLQDRPRAQRSYGAGSGAVAIAVATTTLHAVQVARARPALALRCE